jgi:hypothetical protein
VKVEQRGWARKLPDAAANSVKKSASGQPNLVTPKLGNVFGLGGIRRVRGRGRSRSSGR